MTDTHPITLAAAAEEYGFTVSILRTEIDMGGLAGYRIGKRLYTTRNDLKTMLANYKPKPMSVGPSGIYVVGFANFIKIGFSSFTEKRIEGIQLGIPEKLTVYRCLEGTMRHEKMLHHRFKKYRTRGEWFRHEGELADWVKGGCLT